MAVKNSSTSPPRSSSRARWLLRSMIPNPDREFLIGDLEEIYLQKFLQLGHRRAGWWFWKQTISTLYFWVHHQWKSFRRVRIEEEQSMFDSFTRDLLFAVRLALKRPGFSLVVILTLGLGIGANTAVYNLTDAFLYRRLPVPRADRMVSIFNQNRDGTYQSDLSYAQVRDYQEQSETLAGVLGFSLIRAALKHEGSTEMVFGEAVTGNYFDVLEVRPQMGRTFLASDYGSENTEPVIVISHALCQQRFGSNSDILGTTIDLNGVGYSLVGVAPADFKGSKFALSMHFWIPLQTMPQFRGWLDWDSRLRGSLCTTA